MDDTEHSTDPFVAASRWVSRRGRPGWSAADEAAFGAWRAAAPAHQEALHEALALYRDMGEAASLPPIVHRRPRGNRRWFAATAALLAIGLGAGGWWALRPAATAASATAAELAYATEAGKTGSIELPDGSRVDLDADTRLVWRPDAAGARRLSLERGRAAFRVRHDAEHPFTVAAGTGEVRVLGTVFTVDRRAETVAVRVAEGRVQVAQYVSAGGTRLLEAVLVPGQQAVLGRTIELSVAQGEFAAWSSGRVAFNDLPLAQVAAELERYLGAPVVFDDAPAAALRLSGSFDWRETAPLLAAIEAALPVRIARGADGAYHVGGRSTP